MPKDTLNNKILPECESVRLFSICWEKIRYHWRKKNSKVFL